MQIDSAGCFKASNVERVGAEQGDFSEKWKRESTESITLPSLLGMISRVHHLRVSACL